MPHLTEDAEDWQSGEMRGEGKRTGGQGENPWEYYSSRSAAKRKEKLHHAQQQIHGYQSHNVNRDHVKEQRKERLVGFSKDLQLPSALDLTHLENYRKHCAQVELLREQRRREEQVRTEEEMMLGDILDDISEVGWSTPSNSSLSPDRDDSPPTSPNGNNKDIEKAHCFQQILSVFKKPHGMGSKGLESSKRRMPIPVSRCSNTTFSNCGMSSRSFQSLELEKKPLRPSMKRKLEMDKNMGNHPHPLAGSSPARTGIPAGWVNSGVDENNGTTGDYGSENIRGRERRLHLQHISPINASPLARIPQIDSSPSSSCLPPRLPERKQLPPDFFSSDIKEVLTQIDRKAREIRENGMPPIPPLNSLSSSTLTPSIEPTLRIRNPEFPRESRSMEYLRQECSKRLNHVASQAARMEQEKIKKERCIPSNHKPRVLRKGFNEIDHQGQKLRTSTGCTEAAPQGSLHIMSGGSSGRPRTPT